MDTPINTTITEADVLAFLAEKRRVVMAETGSDYAAIYLEFGDSFNADPNSARWALFTATGGRTDWHATLDAATDSAALASGRGSLAARAEVARKKAAEHLREAEALERQAEKAGGA